MFSICQIESKISEKQAIFSFATPQVTRRLIYQSPKKWISAYDDEESGSEWTPGKEISFLFLLERPYSDLLSLFKEAEETLDKGMLAASFPSNGIVLMALNDSGLYWIDLALKWMDHPEFRFGNELLGRIKELALKKTKHQKLLHRYMKLFARLKKEGLITPDTAPGSPS